MLDRETAKSIADKIVPSDPDWFEAMEVDADKCRELVGAGVEWATHAEEDWRIEHMGMLDMDCEIKSVNAKGAGIVIQVEPKGYMTPEDSAALIALIGKRVRARVIDPTAPLPLDYYDDGTEGGE